MKRQIAAMVLVLFVLAMIGPGIARADVIFEPMDSFYSNHREQCEYVCRYFTATGPNGNVTVYESPESDTVMQTVPNGEEIYISYTYEDETGNQWGCCESWAAELSGWVPIAYLEVVYDGISFWEEFGASIVEESGTMDEAYGNSLVYFWEYPGSSNFEEMDFGAGWTGDLPSYIAVYTDENGTRWGHCSYFYGRRDFWINLDDPTQVPAPTGQVEAMEPPATTAEPVEEIVPQESSQMKTVKIVATAAVAAVVIVTWLLLRKLKKKA